MNLLISIILIALFLIWRLLKPKIKGVIGEATISLFLFMLDSSRYKVINNIVLKVGERTSQIDHIVISDFGIFVIETKNYKGWIFGSENSEYWTQVLYKRRERLYNPIRQNLGHIKALKICLSEYPNLEYKSIIVFSSKADIKVNTRTDVVYSSELLETIKKYSGDNLSNCEKENIFHKINASNLVKVYDKRLHVKTIQHQILKREDFVGINKCPLCGGELKLRDGKFKKFFGCTSYPKCKFSRNI